MTASHRSRQRGVSGMLVIAALVLFGGMAVYGVSAVTSVHIEFAQQVALARAEQAAKAGLDWGRYQIKLGPGGNCPAPATQTLTLPSTLAAYRVTVQCTAYGTFTETGGGPAVNARMFLLTATACNIPGPGGCPNAAAVPGEDYVQKQVSTWVEN